MLIHIKSRLINKENLYSLIIISVLMLIDFISKYIAVYYLKLNESGNIQHVSSFVGDLLFALIYNYELKNPLESSIHFQWLMIISVLFIQLIICFYSNLKKYVKYSLAVCIASFANIIEFIFHGYGTDFLMMNPLVVNNHVIIFNLADVYIVIGVWLVIGSLIYNFCSNCYHHFRSSK